MKGRNERFIGWGREESEREKENRGKGEEKREMKEGRKEEWKQEGRRKRWK